MCSAATDCVTDSGGVASTISGNSTGTSLVPLGGSVGDVSLTDGIESESGGVAATGSGDAADPLWAGSPASGADTGGVASFEAPIVNEIGGGGGVGVETGSGACGGAWVSPASGVIWNDTDAPCASRSSALSPCSAAVSSASGSTPTSVTGSATTELHDMLGIAPRSSPSTRLMSCHRQRPDVT